MRSAATTRSCAHRSYGGVLCFSVDGRARTAPIFPPAPPVPQQPEPHALTRTAAENQWLTSQLPILRCLRPPAANATRCRPPRVLWRQQPQERPRPWERRCGDFPPRCLGGNAARLQRLLPGTPSEPGIAGPTAGRGAGEPCEGSHGVSVEVAQQRGGRAGTACFSPPL